MSHKATCLGCRKPVFDWIIYCPNCQGLRNHDGQQGPKHADLEQRLTDFAARAAGLLPLFAGPRGRG